MSPSPMPAPRIIRKPPYPLLTDTVRDLPEMTPSAVISATIPWFKVARLKLSPGDGGGQMAHSSARRSKEAPALAAAQQIVGLAGVARRAAGRTKPLPALASGHGGQHREALARL